MKKWIIMVCTLILTVVLVGCSQTTQQSETTQQSDEVNEDQAEQTEQPKTNYPEKPIEIIVPFGAGSGPDLVARIYAEAAQKHLPNQEAMVVINKPGGSGIIGATELFQSEPDGHTIGLLTPALLGILPHMGQTPFTHDSFESIFKLTVNPTFFVVNSDSPWQTYEEWLEHVRENPDSFTYGVSVLPQQMAMDAISVAEGVEFKSTMFNSGPEVLNAVLGGHIDGAVMDITATLPQVEAGNLRVLLNVGGTKIDDYPMIEDKGIDFIFDPGTSLWAPKGVSQEIIDILHTAFKKAYEDPQVQETIEKANNITVYSEPEEMQKEVSELFENSRVLLEAAGLAE